MIFVVLANCFQSARAAASPGTLQRYCVSENSSSLLCVVLASTFIVNTIQH